MKYKIVWIDDQWQDNVDFINNLNLMGVEVKAFTNRAEGMKYIDTEIKNVDAVVLDAVFFDEPSTENVKMLGDDELDALGHAISHLKELALKKQLPIFVYTGQAGLKDKFNFFKTLCDGRFYIKAIDDLKLYKDLLKKLESLDDALVKNRYKEVFEAVDALSDYYKPFKAKAEEVLMPILKAFLLPEKEVNFEPILFYNPLRQLVEAIYMVYNRVGLIPDECMNKGDTNLNQCLCYISGAIAEHAGVFYEPCGGFIPTFIYHAINSVIELCNKNSHLIDVEDCTDQFSKMDPEQVGYVETMLTGRGSRFVIYGYALQLCQVIVWSDNYIKEHPDVDENLAHCSSAYGTAQYDKQTRRTYFESDRWSKFHSGEIKLNVNTSGSVRLLRLNVNHQDDNIDYPFYAAFKEI